MEKGTLAMGVAASTDFFWGKKNRRSDSGQQPALSNDITHSLVNQPTSGWRKETKKEKVQQVTAASGDAVLAKQAEEMQC